MNPAMPCLLWRAQGLLVATPIDRVAEVMRPREITALPDAPAFVSGASVIRGRPTPIVDAGVLLSHHRSAPARVILVRLDDQRRIGLAVDEVVGVRALASATISDLPPLLDDARGTTIESIAALDGELMVVLKTMHLVPESVWSELERQNG